MSLMVYLSFFSFFAELYEQERYNDMAFSLCMHMSLLAAYMTLGIYLVAI